MSGLATPDIVLAIIIMISALLGLERGLVKETLSLVIWATAFIAALYFGNTVGDTLGAMLGLQAGASVRGIFGFIAVLISVLIGGAILQWLFAKLIKTTGLTGTDRFLGFLFGAARGIVVCTVALVALRPFVEDAQWWQESKLRPELAKLESGVLAIMGQAKALVLEPDLFDSPDTERI